MCQQGAGVVQHVNLVRKGFIIPYTSNTSISECFLGQTEEEGGGELRGMCTPKSSGAGLYKDVVSVRLSSKECWCPQVC